MRASRVCVLLCTPLYTSMKRIIQSDLQQSKLIEYIISIYLCEDHPSIQDNSKVSTPLQYLDRDRAHLLLPHFLRSFICNPHPWCFALARATLKLLSHVHCFHSTREKPPQAPVQLDLLALFSWDDHVEYDKCI